MTIIDLSQAWSESPLYNQNQAYCLFKSQMTPGATRGFVLIQNGEVVAEAYTEGNEANGLYNAFSVTKSWTSMLIGLLVDDGILQMNETLGDIFVSTVEEEDPTDALAISRATLDDPWEGVEQAAQKQAVTMEEIMTMTSGLRTGTANLQDSLQKVLNQLVYYEEQKGFRFYLGSSNILARIIVARTGMTPHEFALSSGVYEKLGIDPEVDMEWGRTRDGVEWTASQFTTSPRVLAKLGQMYLQKGMVSPTQHLVSESWVRESTKNRLVAGDDSSLPPPMDGYGYLWYTPLDNNEEDGAVAAFGAGGQIIVYYPRFNITLVVMGEGQSANLLNGVFALQAPHNFDLLSVEVGECEGDDLKNQEAGAGEEDSTNSEDAVTSSSRHRISHRMTEIGVINGLFVCFYLL